MTVLLVGLLHGLKFKVQLLAATNHGEIELPELAREAKRRPMLVKIGNELEADRAPQIGETHVRVDWFEFDVSIERKRSPRGHETGKGITVEVIAMRGIGWPIRIRVVWRDDFEPPSRLGDPVQLGNKSHHVGYVFNDVAANHLVEFVVSERIGYDAQIVNHIGMTSWV